jgi:hypothetical protein
VAGAGRRGCWPVPVVAPHVMHWPARTRTHTHTCTYTQFFVVQAYRTVVMQCLSEIAGLNVGSIYDEQFRYLYNGTIRQLTTFFPTNLSTAPLWRAGAHRGWLTRARADGCEQA